VNCVVSRTVENYIPTLPFYIIAYRSLLADHAMCGLNIEI
jgi:hypothetical protein